MPRGRLAVRWGGRALLTTTGTVIAGELVLVVVAGGLVLDAERGVDGANITTAGDALWWSATTVTTVGYGDRFPVTGPWPMVWTCLCPRCAHGPHFWHLDGQPNAGQTS